MKRLLLVAAIAAASFAAPAANAATCVGPYNLNVCVSYSCTGHPCRIDPTTIRVDVTCNHPFQDTCDILGSGSDS